MNYCWTFLREEQAATAVEYAVMLGLILTAIISAISGVGFNTVALWSSSQTQMVSHGLGR